MRRLAIAVVLWMTATSAMADWPATKILPIPEPDPEPGLVDSIVGRFDTGGPGEVIKLYEDGTDPVILDTLDIHSFRQGAVGAINDLSIGVAKDLQILEKQGFPAPILQPLIRDNSTGESYYGIFWKDPTNWGANPAPMRRVCSDEKSFVSVNDHLLSYPYLNGKWVSGGWERDRMIAYMSTTIVHEFVHAIQSNGIVGNCSDSLKWLEEGTADGIANYLVGKRMNDAYNRFGFARNDRLWSVPLDPESTQASGIPTYAYQTGAFFRYLLEASETGGEPDMTILRDIISTPNSQVTTRADVLKAVDNAIKSYTGKRGLYQAFPEFLTEFGSYGGGRYKVYHSKNGASEFGYNNSIPVDIHRWMNSFFEECVEYTVRPGDAIAKYISIDKLAGECIKVSWEGFSQPVALQFFAETNEDRHAHIHIGEVYREDTDGIKRCYDQVTKGQDRRIANDFAKKCILRRGSQQVSGGGTSPSDTGTWTSDFDLKGNGFAYFVVTNIASDAVKTDDLEFDLLVGNLEVKSNGPEDIKPRDTSPGKSVEAGRTNIDKRLHAMQGSGDRLLFDGRSIIGPDVGLGFLEGVPTPGNNREGVMTIVRGGNYWVMFAATGPNNPMSGTDGALIIKNPRALEEGNPFGAIFSGGMLGGMLGSGQPLDCPREVMASVTILEQTKERLVFRIAGNLFDMRGAMMAGTTDNICAALDRAFVERADFTVSIPYGRMYDGDSQIKRTTPPGQDVYDDLEYPSGPSFGGIETGMSLVSLGTDTEDESDPDSDGPVGSKVPASEGSALDEACSCGCPDAVLPDTLFCRAQCEADLALCSPEKGQAPEPLAKVFEDILETGSYPSEARQMLLEDFKRMSRGTQAHIIDLYGGETGSATENGLKPDVPDAENPTEEATNCQYEEQTYRERYCWRDDYGYRRCQYRTKTRRVRVCDPAE